MGWLTKIYFVLQPLICLINFRFRYFGEEREVVFASLANREPYYDAYEEDVAVAHFFFEFPTAFQFVKGVIEF